MPTLDVTGAAARLHAYGTNHPGWCLHYVWEAMSRGVAHYLTGGAMSAYATWQATPTASCHLGDRNVPKDMPAFFGPRPGNALGDVCISNGDGTFTATDYPNGRIGICTLDERATETGRPYLGWSDSMGGYDLITTNLAPAGTGTPSQIGYDMALDPADLDRINIMIQRATRYRLFTSPARTFALNITSGDIMEHGGDPAEISTWENLELVGHGENAVPISEAEETALRARAAIIKARA